MKMFLIQNKWTCEKRIIGKRTYQIKLKTTELLHDDDICSAWESKSMFVNLTLSWSYVDVTLKCSGTAAHHHEHHKARVSRSHRMLRHKYFILKWSTFCLHWNYTYAMAAAAAASAAVIVVVVATAFIVRPRLLALFCGYSRWIWLFILIRFKQMHRVFFCAVHPYFNLRAWA